MLGSLVPGAALAAGAPVIESLSAGEISSTDATLNATIDPNGLSTNYRFSLISPACQREWPVIGPCLAISVWPLPSGSIAAGAGAQSVSLDLNQAGVLLRPGTWYEYGVTATNADGEAQPQETRYAFETLVGEQPVIENESVTDVTATNATLNATIDTRGLYTAYEFEIDTSSGYEYAQMACPLPLPEYAQCMAIVAGPRPSVNEPLPEHIPAGSGVRSVSIDLAGVGTTLQPGTTYHYRAIAANTSNGQIVYGPDQMFTTAASTSPEPPIEPIAATSTRQATSPPILAAPSAVANRGPTPHTRIARKHVRRKREGHGQPAHRRSSRPDRTNVGGRTVS